MAPRPANPPPDRRQEILAAALRVFAAKGYAAATNSEIAREAGVTAAALYYYFPSKADLFRAAVAERRAQIMPALHHVRDELMAMPPAVVLPTLAQTLFTFVSQPETQQVMKLILAEGPRTPEITAIWYEQAIAPATEILFQYVQHQVELGNLKEIDPRVLVLLLQGPVLATVILRDLLGLEPLRGMANDDVLQGLLSHLLPHLLKKKE
jgi:AcrR family transcriptional regulator